MFSLRSSQVFKKKRSWGQKKNRKTVTFIRRKEQQKRLSLAQPDKKLTPWEKILCENRGIKIKEEDTKLMMSEKDKIQNSAAKCVFT